MTKPMVSIDNAIQFPNVCNGSLCVVKVLDPVLLSIVNIPPIHIASSQLTFSSIQFSIKSIIQIKGSGKQPVTIQLEFTGTPPFAPMPPDKHVIKASNVIELYVKLGR